MTKKAQTPTVPSGNPDPNTLQLSKDPAQTDATRSRHGARQRCGQRDDRTHLCKGHVWNARRYR